MVRRAIHSFCGKDYNEFELFEYSCYFILSCLYAIKNGIYMDIYTDDIFSEYIDIVPYKNKNIIDCKCDANNIFTSYSKVIALQNEPLGTIHLDCGVLLKDKDVRKMLDFVGYDCIVQSDVLDTSLDQRLNQTTNSLQSILYPYYMSRDFNKLYNSSVLGFNNEKLKNEWCEQYINMMNDIQEKHIYFSPNSKPNTILDEQQLAAICDFNRYTVRKLFGGQMVKHMDKYFDKYENITDKLSNLSRCILLIKILNKRVYQKLVDKWYDKYSEFFNIEIGNVII